MRSLALTYLKKSAIIALAVAAMPLANSTSAYAQSSQRYESTMQGLVQTVRVEAKIGEDLAYRADHLSPKASDRLHSRSLQDGFGGAGYYGEKDLEALRERLVDKTETQLAKYGITIDENASTVLTVTLTDARPNRPTFKQMSKNPSLSMSSFGLGGATMESSLSRGGEDLGHASYGWYESDIRDAYASATWSDAKRAIGRFSRHIAKDLTNTDSN